VQLDCINIEYIVRSISEIVPYLIFNSVFNRHSS